MVSFTYKVGEGHGVHARPAGLIVNCAKKFKSEVKIRKGEAEADGKRLLSVMGLGAKSGEELVFTVNGTDESVAAEALEKCCNDVIG